MVMSNWLILVKQFWRGIRARLESPDYKYLVEHLSASERQLFFDMAICDQRHALNVAHTAENLAHESGAAIDREFLLRCALLHDVGRLRGDMGLWGKVWAVLANKICAAGAKRMARRGQENWWDYPRHALFVYYHHPWLGARKLIKAGLRREAQIVRRHHAPRDTFSSPILDLLRKADSLN